MKQINNIRSHERVKEMARLLCDQGNGFLIIECEVFKLLNLCGFIRSLKAVCSGKILSRTVPDGALALVDLISYFSRQYSSKFKNGIEFLTAKYPRLFTR